ncbi:sulfotransferase family 2 domain-containing protein [Aquibaculum arenosum]|uniref:Sulfotransferase family 2 domain-containing protein n=1 Tax=Aquibaculum arenosum TaxID=3032591 RepID=A0ABT5YMS0_9PROT|nr:sulfotransferase family 2 domain-containing protein [Fodinicurvata sp. CAU 1616]MDF2096147.1 sulfotransferase family 2 domain-containing protein [Fodinicurvata sp. CAU 1616]
MNISANDYRLIFLHVEKAAGSALRNRLFLNNIAKNYIWWGHDESLSLHQALLIGGHKRLPFYIKQGITHDRTVFCAVIREPVERALSLYHYHYRLGDITKNVNETILSDQTFQKRIENAQNKYLSGQSKFVRTVSLLKENSYIVGTQDELPRFISVFEAQLGLIPDGPVVGNSGPKGYKQDLDVSEEAYVRLLTLLAEDILLYTYISQQFSGLFCNVCPSKWDALGQSLRSARS